MTKLIRDKQPQLYEYLLKIRDKNEVKKLVNLDVKQPFVYVSGRLDSQYNKATVAFPLTAGKNGNVIVYDLRYDPTPFVAMDVKNLTKKLYASWEERQKDGFIKLPVKELQYNRAPAVAPLSVLSRSDGWKNIGLDEAIIAKHRTTLLNAPAFAENIRSLFEEKKEYAKTSDPEAQLYDGFIGNMDKMRVETVRNASERELADFHPSFDDDRLPPLLLHYKARNFPKTLSEEEAVVWEKWRAAKITAALPVVMKSLQKLGTTITDTSKQFVLQELQLWAESVLPTDIDD